jgi:hypothetical protein
MFGLFRLLLLELLRVVLGHAHLLRGVLKQGHRLIDADELEVLLVVGDAEPALPFQYC